MWDNDLAASSSREKGNTEGRIEGKIEKSRQIAIEMKADGMAADLIAKYTDLTIEEIERL